MPTYTPINALVFYAAHAGAISGMAISGWIVDPAKADYSQVVGIAAAFAQAFDQAWDNTAPISVFEGEAITAVVASDFRLRGPGPLAYPVYSNPTSWAQAAAACVALILECDAYFASQSLVPPPYPTSGLLQTAYNQSTGIVLPFGAVNPSQVVNVPGVNVPANCKVIATFDGVVRPTTGNEGTYTFGYSIGIGTAYKTIVRTATLAGASPATLPFSYTYEFTPNQISGLNLTISALGILAAETSATDSLTVDYASLLVEVVSL
jgi:hypothetical protein